MNTKLTIIKRAALLVLLSTLNPQLSTWAQGTAFTYQGRLQNNGSPANGSYDVEFTLYSTNVTGSPVAGPVTNSATAVSNGLFTATVDFGPGVFAGANYWLDLAVRTNGGGAFMELTPRQPLTPAPYAIYAESVDASGINGTLTNGQLAHSAVTVNAGPGLSGGGKVGLGNTITLTNTGVLSVTGNADITAATVGGAVTLSDTATSADTAGTLVKRDGSGNFSAATITLDDNLRLPATTATAGIIYSGGSTLVHAYGSLNFFSGIGAGNFTMTGFANEGVGYQALNANISGSYNAANGVEALLYNTSGSYNTANGVEALLNNLTGSNNTANGYAALYNNTSGSYNTADGDEALLKNTNGFDNTANGYRALFNNTSGSYNTANGYEALYLSTNGDGSTAIGYQALYSNTSGYANTANGYNALYNNTVGFDNTASGAGALIANTSGHDNTANGYDALYYNTTGFHNTAHGAFALFNNTLGSENTANGAESLNANTGGSNNAANGYRTLYNNTSGNYNTANGWEALLHCTTGVFNVASGEEALLKDTDGSYNVAVGGGALYNNNNNGNTAVGNQALFSNTTGFNNIAVGASAGQSLTTGDNNIDIGSDGSAGEANTIRIGFQGTQTATFIAGIYGTTVSGSAVTVNSNGRLGVAPSSRRFKQDILSMDNASDVLLALRPVTFRYKPDIDPQGTPQFGLVAEEVAKVDPDLVVRDGKDQIFTVRYEAVNAMLLNEFLKEHRTVEELSQKVEAQKSENTELKRRLEALEKVVLNQKAN